MPIPVHPLNLDSCVADLDRQAARQWSALRGHVCMYVCMYVWVCMCLCLHVCVCMHIHPHPHAHPPTYSKTAHRPGAPELSSTRKCPLSVRTVPPTPRTVSPLIKNHTNPAFSMISHRQVSLMCDGRLLRVPPSRPICGWAAHACE